MKKEKCGKLCFLYKNNGKIKRVIVEYVGVKSKKNRMFLRYHKQIRYYLIRNYYSRKGSYTEGERE